MTEIQALTNVLDKNSNHKVKIVHHIDPDGFFGAHHIRNAVRWINKDVEIEYIEFNYGREVPKFEETDIVILVDISFPMEDMVIVSQNVELFFWIDHHKSAIDEFNKLDVSDKMFILNDHTTSDNAGCENAWLFTGEELEDIPLQTKLVGQYDNYNQTDFTILKDKFGKALLMTKDVFNDKYPNTKWLKDLDINIFQELVIPYYKYICSIIQSPKHIDKYLNDIENYTQAFKTGIAINKHSDNNSRFQCKNAGTNVLFENTLKNRILNKLNLLRIFHINGKAKGHRCVILNTANSAKDTFKSVIPKGDPNNICFSFVYDLRKNIVKGSLRGDINCDVIAKSYGGGGHAGAAGFSVKKLNEIILLKNI